MIHAESSQDKQYPVLQNGELTLDQVQPAYAIIDAFHHKKVPGFDIEGFDNLMVIAKDAKQLQEEQDLFDLNVSSYLKLQRCGEQLSYLKSCWDMVGTVMYTFTDWYKTLWDKIDVDFLSEETKKLQKDIKSLNKAVRNYEVWISHVPSGNRNKWRCLRNFWSAA